MESHVRAMACVRRKFRAPVECVFDAWLDPVMLDEWMFGAALARGECVRLMTDPSVGGAYSFVLTREEREIRRVGTYLEIERPQRLVFTWALDQETPDSDRVTLEMWPIESGCEVALTHELAPERAERATEAWTEMLDALGRAVRVDAAPPLPPSPALSRLSMLSARPLSRRPDVRPRRGLGYVAAVAWLSAAFAVIWQACMGKWPGMPAP